MEARLSDACLVTFTMVLFCWIIWEVLNTI